METATQQKYKVENGTSFHIETADKVCSILSNAIASRHRQRLKLHYGDVATGRDWCEENYTIGYIGRSTGTSKIPLLIHNSKSHGGGAILDHCILKIVDVRTKEVLYQSPNYIAPIVEIKEGSDWPGYTNETWVNGQLYGRHKSLKSAKILKGKLVSPNPRTNVF